jgi:hypothetical protein
MPRLVLIVLACDTPEVSDTRGDRIRIDVTADGRASSLPPRDMVEGQRWQIDFTIAFESEAQINLFQEDRNHSLGRLDVQADVTRTEDSPWARFQWHGAHYTLRYRVLEDAPAREEPSGSDSPSSGEVSGTVATAAPDAPTPVTLPRENCWVHTPSASDTLVIARAEHGAPVSDLTNWADDTIFHEERRATICRQEENINAVVLHETGGWGFDDPSSAPRTWRNGPHISHWTHRSAIAAHFVVHSDGSIAQHYDVVQRLGHAGPRNEISVGIEFVNPVFGYVRQPNNHPHESPEWKYRMRVVNYAGEDYRVARGGRHFDTVLWWGRGRQDEDWRYVVPSVDALEALNDLLGRLMFHFDVPKDWLSLSHGEDDHLFLMWHWDDWYGDEGSDRAGVYSHFNIGGHTDGSFQALYTWLRRRRGLGPAAARRTAMDLVNAPLTGEDTTWVRRGGRRFIDISGISAPA